MTPDASPTGTRAGTSGTFPLRPDGTWSPADAGDRARRLIAARRWHRRAELAARRAARASATVS